MKLRTSEAFWLMKNGFLQPYGTLENELQTEIAVIGGGITGALAAYYLAKSGLEVTVLEKRHPGMGSTAASTALLQYEIDQPLHLLKKIVGAKRAEQSYLACAEALAKLERVIKKEKLEVDFELVPSLQYASYKKDVSSLHEELKARKSLGLTVDFLDAREIKEKFSFSAPGAIWSAKGGKVDAYALAHGLFSVGGANLQVFDGVEVKRLECQGKQVILETTSGLKIFAKYVVIACGYESQKFLPSPVATIGATYAFATKPLAFAFLAEQTLLWETKTPYLYLRTTADGRIIAGGRDDNQLKKNKINQLLPGKIRGLVNDVEKLLGFKVTADFSWAGAFASTKDSLGYVGPIKQLPRVFFVLGYGGNGILYSQIGAEIVRDSILNRKNKWKNIFAFNR